MSENLVEMKLRDGRSVFVTPRQRAVIEAASAWASCRHERRTRVTDAEGQTRDLCNLCGSMQRDDGEWGSARLTGAVLMAIDEMASDLLAASNGRGGGQLVSRGTVARLRDRAGRRRG